MRPMPEDHPVGVPKPAPEPPGLGWAPIARFADLAPGRGRAVTLDGERVVLYRLGESVHALAERCPHQGRPLALDLANDCIAFCPAHGWSFDVRTGRNRSFRSGHARTYRVRVAGGTVYLRRRLLGWLRACARSGRR